MIMWYETYGVHLWTLPSDRSHPAKIQSYCNAVKITRVVKRCWEFELAAATFLSRGLKKCLVITMRSTKWGKALHHLLPFLSESLPSFLTTERLKRGSGFPILKVHFNAGGVQRVQKCFLNRGVLTKAKLVTTSQKRFPISGSHNNMTIFLDHVTNFQSHVIWI